MWGHGLQARLITYFLRFTFFIYDTEEVKSPVNNGFF